MAPITEQLKTATELEAAGLPQAAARVLAAKFEETAALAKKSAEDGIAGRFDKIDAQFEKTAAQFEKLEAQFEARFEKLQAHLDTRLAELRAEMQQAFRSSQSTTLTAIRIATGFLAVLFAALTFVLHYAH